MIQQKSDVIAIFDREGKATIGFLIEGRWSRVIEQGGQIRTWTSPEEARDFLHWSMQHYLTKYGETLWDVDAVPVLKAAN